MTCLDKINSPADLKKLDMEELKTLAGDVRAAAVLNRDSKIGGHVGPNLNCRNRNCASLCA